MPPITCNGRPIPVLDSPNHSARPAGMRPRLIVLHATGGSAASARDWLCRRASRVSAHYLIDRTGRVEQLVSPERAAWHAGQSCWQGRSNVNAFSLGLELAHRQGEDWPDAQLRAAAALCRALQARYAIPATHITSHAHIARPAGRKTDPESFPWPAFRTLLHDPLPARERGTT